MQSAFKVIISAHSSKFYVVMGGIGASNEQQVALLLKKINLFIKLLYLFFNQVL